MLEVTDLIVFVLGKEMDQVIEIVSNLLSQGSLGTQQACPQSRSLVTPDIRLYSQLTQKGLHWKKIFTDTGRCW